MKYLKYLLYVIIVLALIFFGNGLITSEVTYESQISVNKPVEEAWAVMADESKITDWLKEIKRMEAVSGTPMTVGAVSNIYVEQGGEEMVMQETITAIKENELMAMTFTMDFMNMDYQMTLKEVDGVTQITTTSSTVGNGLFAHSIVSFMGGSMKKQEDINLNNLKTVIESNTTNYFPETSAEPVEEMGADSSLEVSETELPME